LAKTHASEQWKAAWSQVMLQRWQVQTLLLPQVMLQRWQVQTLLLPQVMLQRLQVQTPSRLAQ
jgi:hypothetical protein